MSSHNTIIDSSSSSSNRPNENNTLTGNTSTTQDHAESQGGNTEQGEDQPCQSCGAFPARFQCSACQSVRYCSQECQSADWRMHYRECEEFIQAKREDQGETRVLSNSNGGEIAPGEIGPNQPQSANTHLGGDEAENVRAIADRPRRRPREPRSRPRLTPEQIAAYEEAERIADMKFYMLQVYKIIKPVVVCICLSIIWVKVSMAGSDYRPTQSSYTVYKETSTSTVAQNFVGSLANAGIIIGQIVIVTIIIVVLFKRGHIKVLIGFFMVVVAMLLGFMGYILVLNLIQVLRIPLDYVTMSFALWNFSVVGLVSVFWKGPMWLQQVYLTFMSSLMDLILVGILDLIAVLCPFGPLKVLVESSRNQNQEVPALLYTVNAVWFMASPPDSILARENLNRSKETTSTTQSLLVDISEDNQRESKPKNGQYTHSNGRESGIDYSSSFSSALGMSLNDGDSLRSSSTIGLVRATANESENGRDNIEMVERTNSRGSPASSRSEGSPLAGRSGQQTRTRDISEGDRRLESNVQSESGGNGQQDDDDDDGGGLKLGLGDFVFYSVLVARAAMDDWVTTMCCMVAVLTGMNATIFLLAIYQKALPALPISICFGMLFYFATRNALVPFLDVLGPHQVFI
ncbi:Presenilin-1 [Entomortierella beljakovae]|nr:Presenilin-1 [Entomortierella beljakovae]